MIRMHRSAPLPLAAIALAGLLACATGQTSKQTHAKAAPVPALPFDPVDADAPADTSAPASLEEVAIPSGESYMNGVVYVAPGAGPHPVVVVLHGYPGNEQNGDLAQSLRRAGFDVLLFHYRGSWGSEGRFSFANALEDVESAIEFVRTDRFAERYRADPSRLTLVGHSMGGFLAIMASAANPNVRCTASLAGANLGRFGAGAAADPAQREALEKAFGGWSGPIRGESGKKLAKELITNAAAYDLVGRAPAIAGRPVLLVAGSRDTVVPPAQNQDPLVAALAAAGAKNVRSEVFDTDHAFSDSRIALAHALVDWARAECQSALPPPPPPKAAPGRHKPKR